MGILSGCMQSRRAAFSLWLKCVGKQWADDGEDQPLGEECKTDREQGMGCSGGKPSIAAERDVLGEDQDSRTQQQPRPPIMQRISNGFLPPSFIGNRHLTGEDGHDQQPYAKQPRKRLDRFRCEGVGGGFGHFGLA